MSDIISPIAGIAGIANRTPQEVFDIMAERMRGDAELASMANKKALQLLARNDEVESALCRSQALMEEMVEGLAEFVRLFPVRVNEGDLQFCQSMEALIAKARLEMGAL